MVGYDHCLVVTSDFGADGLRDVCQVTHPASGRVLACRSDCPGVQFYTGNYLDGRIVGKGGKRLAKHAGFCLETQAFPDAPNHAAFPTAVLRPGETYRRRTEYRFATLP